MEFKNKVRKDMATDNPDNTIRENYKVTGMTCASCAISLESYLTPVEGVKSVSVNYPNQTVSIEFDKNVVSIESLQKKAREITYDILIGESKATQKTFDEIEEKRINSLRSKLIFSASIMMISFAGFG